MYIHVYRIRLTDIEAGADPLNELLNDIFRLPFGRLGQPCSGGRALSGRRGGRGQFHAANGRGWVRGARGRGRDQVAAGK